jgi:hypothetical protein
MYTSRLPRPQDAMEGLAVLHEGNNLAASFQLAEVLDW